MSALGSGPKAPPRALGVVTVGGQSVEEEARPPLPPPVSQPGDSFETTCGGRQPAGRSVSATHAGTDPSLRGPLGSTQPNNDIPVTGRDQEVLAARTGGPKVFVRISSLATPPRSLSYGPGGGTQLHQGQRGVGVGGLPA